ncbi:hypothetical protein [Halosimplex salinum]|uniref:hypothetical protein n=1 Tax=Halosimplex salinum TaxID=1710538 RepID=UPI000F46E8F1|nr:hypothetical protein [Halosimplex salinum]
MTSDQIWSHEVTYHPEDVQDRSKCHSPDYRVYLPDTIKKLGLGKNVYAVVEREVQDGIPYLKGSKLTEEDDETPDSDSVYEIFIDGSSRLRVTLSSDWVDEFIEYDGDDIFAVEVNEIDDEFRIYRNDDYDTRKQELSERGISPRLGKPLVLGSAMFYKTRYSETNSLREGFGDDVDDDGPGDDDEWNTKDAVNNDNGTPPTPP